MHKITFYNYSYKYYTPAFSKLWAEIILKEKVKYHNEKIKFEKFLELKNVSFNYEDNENVVIDKLNLKIQKIKLLEFMEKVDLEKQLC